MHFKKKMAVVLSTALLTTMIAGCTQAAATDASTATATYTQGEISESTLNDALVAKYGLATLFDLVDKSILDTVEPVTPEMESTVDANLANIKDYYKDDFEKSLKISGFKDEADFRTSLVLNEQRQAYVEKYVIANVITDADIQAYYDNYAPEIEASHILITPADDSEASSALAKEQARALIERINAGEDFAALAKEYSKDPGSGANGGALGSFGKGMMVAPFEEAAYALKNGEVTQTPVQTQFGFHIIKRTGGEEKQSLEAMKDTIIQTLAADKIKDDTNLSYKAMIQLREENGFKISNPIMSDQYNLYTERILETAN
ncbi:MAG: peptidylprolyl isomerase [Clostridia bacterium]|nr:peptidylprolyl isomerase [Clostridia bacterium]